jgi:uncharacterized protein (UPF0332 family)
MAEIDRVFWEKAQENLEAAQSEFINRRYNSCANRAYYACFQAAVYALAHANIRPNRSEWGHDFVQSQFNGELINRRKLYPSDLRSALNQNYILRQTADYTTDHVSETRAGRALERTEVFLEAVRARGVERR